MELWTQTEAAPKRSAQAAGDAEEARWAGLCVGDSQNLSGDPFVDLAMAAATTHFRLEVMVAEMLPAAGPS